MSRSDATNIAPYSLKIFFATVLVLKEQTSSNNEFGSAADDFSGPTLDRFETTSRKSATPPVWAAAMNVLIKSVKMAAHILIIFKMIDYTSNIIDMVL